MKRQNKPTQTQPKPRSYSLLYSGFKHISFETNVLVQNCVNKDDTDSNFALKCIDISKIINFTIHSFDKTAM